LQTRRAELIEQRLLEAERVQARRKLVETEKELSSVIYEQTGGNQDFALATGAKIDHFVDVNKMVSDPMASKFTRCSGFRNRAARKIPPFGIAQQMLKITGQPELDSTFRAVGVCFEILRKALHQIRLHVSS
jgi:hypothetical protein